MVVDVKYIMKHRVLWLILSVVLSSRLVAQPEPIWENSFVFGVWNQVSGLAAAPNGDLIAGITVGSAYMTDYSFWLIRVDSSGNLIWDSNYENPMLSNSGMEDMLLLEDGRILVCGWGVVSGTKRCCRLVMTDADGQLLWEVIHDDPVNTMYIEAAESTSDGGFIFTGGYGEQYLDEDILILKTDSLGSIEWMKTYPIRYRDTGETISEISDGGYIISATVGYSLNRPNLCVLRTDTQGSVLWYTIYNSTELFMYPQDVYETSSGNFQGAVRMFKQITGGYTVLYELSGDGYEEWMKELDNDNSETNDFIPGDNGAFLHTGFTDDHDSVFLMQTDSLGNIDWYTTCSSDPYSSTSYRLCTMPDGGFGVGAWKGEAAWLIRFSAYSGVSLPPMNGSDFTCTCHPNPFTESLTISFNPEPLSHVLMRVYDLSGRLVAMETVSPAQASNGLITWVPEESIPTGCYRISLEMDGQRAFSNCVYVK